MSAVRARPGPGSTSWLCDRISKLQEADVMAPATVIVPTTYSGVWVRRHLAKAGYANVRFVIMDRLVELLGAQRLTEEGKKPLNAIVTQSLVRLALQESGRHFGNVSQHPALISRLGQLFDELRSNEDDEREVNDLATASRGANAAVVTWRAFERLRSRHGFYDKVDLREAACAALQSPGGRSLLSDLGALVVYFPTRLVPSQVRFVRACAEHATVEVVLPAFDDEVADQPSRRLAQLFGFDWNDIPQIHDNQNSESAGAVIIAPDPVEEVRAVVRQILAEMERESATPLHRTALVYRQADTYGPLVREFLDSAGLPYVALQRKPVSQSIAGRALLGLLALPSSNFSRPAVLNWLSLSPGARFQQPSVHRWDSLSRSAGIVRGASEWVAQLRRLTAEFDARARDAKAEDDEEKSTQFQRSAQDCTLIIERIQELEQMSRPPPDHTTWSRLTQWAQTIRTRFVPTDSGWNQEESEAAEMVDETLASLTAAQGLEPEVSLETFVATLQRALELRRRPEGKLGEGVVLAEPESVLGLDLDRVFILVMTERAYPTPLPVDPFTNDRRAHQATIQNLAGERMAYLTALSATRDDSITLSFPSADEEHRKMYASSWLLEAAGRLGGKRLVSLDRDVIGDAPWLTRITTTQSGILNAAAHLNLAERRTCQSLAEWQAGSAVAGLPLAQRADLPLRQAIRVRRGRGSRRLSEFDGNLSELSGSGLLEGVSGATVSPTALETWAACPFSYFVGRVIKVVPTERPEYDESWTIAATDRGSLVHSILQSFFEELRDDGCLTAGLRYTDDDYTRLDRIAHTQFAAAEAQGLTGHPLIWRNEQAMILSDLHGLLVEDDEQRGGEWVPSGFEATFGMDGADSWPPARLDLTNGPVTFRGRIDRVDLAENGERVRVIDYKTGREKDAPSVADNFSAGTQLQLAVYSVAVRQEARSRGLEPREIEALYWYITFKNAFKTKVLRYHPEVESALLHIASTIDTGMRAGCFRQVPGQETQRLGRHTWDNCAYCDFDRICPSGRYRVAERKSDDAVSRRHAVLSAGVEDE